MDKAAKALANSEIVSVSRRITMLEMKELNERQRAEHAQKMYEHLRNSFKQVEERNFELETKFAEVGLIYLLHPSPSIHPEYDHIEKHFQHLSLNILFYFL